MGVSLGRKRTVNVGDKFLLNCGVEVEVIKYHNCRNVCVQDINGNMKATTSDQLRAGCVKWSEFGVTTHPRKRPPIKNGDYFTNKHGETFKIIDAVEYSKILVEFVETSNRQWTTKGLILDDSITDTIKRQEVLAKKAHAKSLKSRVKHVTIGSRFQSRLFGWYEVIAVLSEEELSIKFDNTGNVKTVLKRQATSGKVVDTIERVSKNSRHKEFQPDRSGKEWDYLKPTPNKCYIYFVHYNNEVVYIGKGKGRRYLHPDSGTSHVFELNRLYFNYEEVVVSIFKDNLSDEDATTMERELIISMQPRFNTRVCKIL